MRLPALAALGLVAALPARAATADWSQVCDLVGHFARLAATVHGDGMTVGKTAALVGRMLNDPVVSMPDAAVEITREVYAAGWDPDQAEAAMRQRCLGRSVGHPDAVVVAARPAVSGLSPIKLNVGVNRVRHATPDDANVNIMLEWSGSGQGGGHDVFTAMVAGSGAVGMPDGYAAVDDPAGDRDMRRSVRFAKGRVNGQDSLLLLTATREPGAGSTPTVYRVYRLSRDQTGYRFDPVAQELLPDRYCNADVALSAASGLPLRASYRGLRTPSGCPTSTIAKENQ